MWLWVWQCVWALLTSSVFSLRSSVSVIWGSEVTFQGWILSAAAEARQRAAPPPPTSPASPKPDWADKIDGAEEEEEEEEGCDNIISYIPEPPRLFQTWVIPPPKILSGWHHGFSLKSTKTKLFQGTTISIQNIVDCKKNCKNCKIPWTYSTQFANEALSV